MFIFVQVGMVRIQLWQYIWHLRIQMGIGRKVRFSLHKLS